MTIRRLLVVLAVVGGMALLPAIAQAHCPASASHDNGVWCSQHPTPTATPAPTSPPAPASPAPAVATTPHTTPQPGSPNSHNTVLICHYEPTTGNFELRHVQPDQVEDRLKQGDTLPEDDLCKQLTADVPTPMPIATSTPVPTVTVQPATATPASVEVTSEPTPLPEPTPNVAPTGTPDSPEPTPEPRVPTGLPDTGDGSTATEFEP